ncbi:hypothetical protein Theam_1822 (plasmid) [Thermovibrio ammonificans HB-1]|uniref:Uncharacterized protein n=1 Tax=Thermovibrio ammonificans (strain DSM 15698 / JCM 12110 / HB-1) TaxID=648996 RepID=E8T6V5_THEA1|nr:hypothetical protein [Thermovibrio ammonificans]ADU97778.1 hypothetical protein Theam_1822 [Thermovibrio ammonificans HB-1]
MEWRERVKRLAGRYKARCYYETNPWDYEQERVEWEITLPSGKVLTLRRSYWLNGSPTFEVRR